MGLEFRAVMALPILMISIRVLWVSLCALLLACGGGGSASNIVSPTSSIGNSSIPISSPVSSSFASSQSSSSLAGLITLSGKVTYDFVPYSNAHNGLDYSAITVKPVRGAVVELRDEHNALVATGITDSAGDYGLNVVRDKLVKVRVNAQLLQTQSPTWDFKVTDNTNGNKLYVMEGGLVAASEMTAVRNLHAASGWSGSSYTQPRVAAPFAMLDSILLGVYRLAEAGNTNDFPPLDLRWSSLNKAAEGEPTLGEIGTSFYSDLAIYILGDQNNDTDEYDRHVILHEWGHYLEDAFSRSDSPGGDHAYDDKLDMRVALSEGFANALSAIFLDDPLYRDTSGTQQLDGFTNNVSHKNHAVRGWYSEASIQSIIYSFYGGSQDDSAQNFKDIFSVFNSEGYFNNEAMLSIYVFSDELRQFNSAQFEKFNTLLLGQNIEANNAFGEGESNSGGYSGALPIYKKIEAGGSSVNVCSTNRFGAYNKLGVAQFLKLDIVSSGVYEITAQKIVDDSGASDPDIYLYHRGEKLVIAESGETDQETLLHQLSAGAYVLEVIDYRAVDIGNSESITTCFTVRAQKY